MIGIHSNHLSEQWHECLCARRRLSNKRVIYIWRILAMEFTLSRVYHVLKLIWSEILLMSSATITVIVTEIVLSNIKIDLYVQAKYTVLNIIL